MTPAKNRWAASQRRIFQTASWRKLLLTRKTLRGASFRSKDQLREAIEAFLTRHNEQAKPFKWRKREVKGSQLRNTIINLCN